MADASGSTFMPPLPPISLPRFRAAVPAGSSEAAGEVAIPVRLSGELRRRIGSMARRTGRTAAELIAAGVAEYMGAMEARLAAGAGADARTDLTGSGSAPARAFSAPRILAQVRAHARLQEKAQAKARAQLMAQNRDPLDRFFNRPTPEQNLEQTYSVAARGM